MNRSEQNISDENDSQEIDKLVRTAILCTITGMLFVLLFLIVGFKAWSVGIGVFLGMPVMIFGMGLYIVAVFRDLKSRKVLDSDNK
ncbi:hypothetical protein SAMN06265219_102377 [Gracilimonas mengyeensis]|uniref:Uncharacterized protein n=1 Tax=Gracilimonas mengyeensis TaxID=1302730 RepID=A0A521BLF7_9BACT|nr:hypothetical protein SAMN06265219_102377 [Gracilimonas mengyeensis]